VLTASEAHFFGDLVPPALRKTLVEDRNLTARCSYI
jgi:hypothetical protein